MATVTTTRRPSGTSGFVCPDFCPPRLFSEPSGPETEFCLFPLALAVVVRCAGGTGWLYSAHSKEGSPSTQQPRSLCCSPQPPLGSLGLITGSVPVLCCVGGKDWRFWFLFCELYLRTFFFIGGSMAPAACTRSLLYTFNQTLFQTKGQNLIAPMVSFFSLLLSCTGHPGCQGASDFPHQ